MFEELDLKIGSTDLKSKPQWYTQPCHILTNGPACCGTGGRGECC